MLDALKIPAEFKCEKLSALVVDDERLVTMFLADVLTDLGFEVATAATATESLAVANRYGEFSVAFIDLGLPDRSRLELISDLKTVYPAMPIVIASGYGLMASRDLDKSGHRVLCKPYGRKAVADLLAALGFRLPPSH